MTSPDILTVHDVNHVLKNGDVNTLADILCPLSNYQMMVLLNNYQQSKMNQFINMSCEYTKTNYFFCSSVYNKPLQDDIKEHTSVKSRLIFLELCLCKRNESNETNVEQAVQAAQRLSVSSDGTDNVEAFIQIFSEQSFPQLKIV